MAGSQTTQASKDHAWYLTDVKARLPQPMRDLLEQYSKVPHEDVEAHILKTREQAYEVFPFPCIGNFWYLKLGLSQHPHYPEILNILRAPNPALDSTDKPPRLLDLGTCLGQDLRKLAFDGVPKERLFGSDYFPAYESAGHALFCDKDTWTGRFFGADLLADQSELVSSQGTWDIVSLNMVLHVFGKADCAKAARRVLSLLKPGKGQIVLGTMSGSLEPGELTIKSMQNTGRDGAARERTLYRHSPETLTAMWQEEARALGREVEVEVEIKEKSAEAVQKSASFFSKETDRRLSFYVKTLS